MARAAKASAKMSTAHKEALAQGRSESLVVRNYLEALTSNKPKRGRKRTPASIDARLKAIAAKIDGADALTKLSRKGLEGRWRQADSLRLSSFCMNRATRRVRPVVLPRRVRGAALIRR